MLQQLHISAVNACQPLNAARMHLLLLPESNVLMLQVFNANVEARHKAEAQSRLLSQHAMAAASDEGWQMQNKHDTAHPSPSMLCNALQANWCSHAAWKLTPHALFWLSKLAVPSCTRASGCCQAATVENTKAADDDVSTSWPSSRAGHVEATALAHLLEGAHSCI